VVLIGAGATGLVWGLIRAGEIGWASVEVAATLAVGVLLVGCFIAWEARAIDPMLPLRLFRSRSFAAATTTGLLMSGSIFSAAFLIAQYFQVGLGYSPLESGVRVLPWTATPLVFAPIAGALSDRIGRRPLLVTGLLLQGAGLVWIASLASTGTAYGLLVVPLLVSGIGISIALPLAPTAVMSAVAPADIGKASGVNSTMQRFGAAFALAIASAVFAANGHLGSAASFTDGFRPALTVVAALAVLGAIAAVGVRMPATVRVDAAATAARAA